MTDTHMRRLTRVLVSVVWAGLVAGCGRAPAAPSSSTAPPEQNATPHGGFTLTGRVVGTVTGEPVGGATVTIGDRAIVTGTDGAFRLTDTGAGTRVVTIAGEGILSRTTRLSFFDRDLTIDVIQNRPPFDLAYFRELGRNALESSGGLEPLRPLSVAPRIHIRTVDQAGEPVSDAILEAVEAAIRGTSPVWSAGRLPVEVVERGPDTREGQSGWVTVLFAPEIVPGTCGRATLGSSTGRIELNYRNQGCSCGGYVVAPRTIRHELGHVYGYWHTTVRGGVMSRDWTTRQCDGRPSAREIEHARYMYSRPSGNLDPDADPVSTVLRAPREILIEN
jgi:hypothetical protein